MENNIVYKGEYFNIKKLELQGRKTPVYEMYDNNSIKIADIKWHGAWRKFCFFPTNDSLWDTKCLTEIITELDKYNLKWRESKGGKEMAKVELVWNVLLHDFNSDRIITYNVLKHSGDLVDEIVKSVKKSGVMSYDDFKDLVSLKFKSVYWCRTEYEILVSGMFTKADPEKIDAWHQIEINLDNFLDYLITKLKLNVERK